MSRLLDFLAGLTQQGVEVWADGEMLRCSAPPGILTPTVLGALGERKAEILTFLRQPVTTASFGPEPVARTGALPASFAQQQLWVLDQLGYGTAYHMSLAVELEGRLDMTVLSRALDEIVRRHESLRSTFVQVDGKVLQAIHAPPEATLAVTDLRSLDAAARRAAVGRWIETETRAPFDLARDPMLRARLLRTGAEAAILLLTLHHVASDGWSMAVLTREFEDLYAAFAAGSPSPLLDLPIQYADFAVWQRSRLRGEVLEQELRFWRERLEGAPHLLNLPIAAEPRASSRSSAVELRGACVTFSLGAEVTRALRALGRRKGATLFMTLLAAFQVLLSRYSGQDDVLVGAPVANRTHRVLEPMIGYFINTLVLRADLAENPSFLDFLAQVRETTLSAYEHQELPFERLVEELKVERIPNRNPLVQVLFALQNAGEVDITLPGLTVHRMALETRTARMDLEVDVVEEGDHLEGFWVYSAGRFEATAMERMVGHLQMLLSEIVADPSRRIGELTLLTAHEQRQILVEWNDTAADFPCDQCIHRLFEVQAARTPDTSAVVFDKMADGSGPARLTYRELNERSSQLAHHLKGLGVGPEALVGLCVERSLEMVVGILGILKAGGAYVPIDPEHPPDRIAFILRDTQASIVLTQAHLAACLPAENARVIRLDAEWEAIALQPMTMPTSDVGLSNLAYVIYTSGSTGRPKGVLVEHHSLVAHCAHYVRFHALTPSDRVLGLAALHFDASVEQLFPALIVGARVILPAWELEPRSFSQKLVELGVTIVDTSGVHWRALVDEWLKTPALIEGSRLRALIVGGDVMPADVLQRWRKAPLSARARLFNVYGPTEITVAATVYEITRDFDDERARIPIGRPLSNRTAYVLDRHRRPVPVGVPGELYIGGIGPARGYLNEPELTQEKFVTLDYPPFAPVGIAVDAPRGRLYRTGDLVQWLADGTLDFLGRVDDQVKIRGYRVELGEIEAHLKQHPAVRDAVVVVHEENNHRSLVAYVVAGEARASEAELRSELHTALRKSLPEYMVPFRFLVIDEMPRVETSGKVDKAALPHPGLAGGGAPFVSPSGLYEVTLAALFRNVLALERVGVHDNFFDLGGHSLLATQLNSRINQAFSVKLPLQRIFERPTVAELAKAIQGALGKEDTPPLQPVARGGDLPLSFAQQRLWFLDQMGSGAAYNMPLSLRLHGELSVPALAQSITEIVRRHESLRTTFMVKDGETRQVIHLAAPMALPVIDLTRLPPMQQESEVKRLAQAEVHRPFDLARDPMLRATLLRSGRSPSSVHSPEASASIEDAGSRTRDHVLLLTMHHIASDGWSMGVLVRELTALYAAFSEGGISPLPDLPVQYADFAVWQRQWLQGEVLAEQVAYWKKQLAGAPALLQLPTDHARPAAATFHGQSTRLHIGAELTQALRALSQQAGATLFMTLLAAFQALLSRYSAQEDVVVGAPIANRNRQEIEPLIGFFVNTLALRADLSGNPTFLDLLAQVRQTTQDAYARQDLPFERLVEELHPERSPSFHPLVQVALALQNTPEADLTLPGVEISPLPLEAPHVRLDIEVHLSEREDALTGHWIYNADLFEAATIERCSDHFQSLLARIVDNPQERVGQLSLLGEAERRRIVVEWNDTSVDVPRDPCIHALFEAQVERTPEAEAVLFDDGTREATLTYRELNERSNQLAHHLQSLGVGPEVVVGLCVERSLEMVVGILAILKAGGAYLPLDPAYPAARLAFMLADAGPPVLLTQARLAPEFPGRGPRIVCLDRDWPTIASSSQANPSRKVKAENLAYVIYTSGSTGDPKGVLLEHRGLLNVSDAQARLFELTPADRVLQFASPSFDAATFELWMALSSGATLCLGAREALSPGEPLQRFLARHRITIVTLIPSALAAVPAAALPDLHTIIVAGEACSADLVRSWSRGRRFFNLYGPTEATIWSTAMRCTEPSEEPPIGRPIANTQVYILDRYSNPTPVGVPGELCIGGAGVARGYLNRPALTQERFMASPFGDGKLYKTGDLARYREGGNIEFLGRIDQQVKLRGFRIELGEIEAALSDHPLVREAVVIVRKDQPGSPRLVAYVVPEAGDEATQAEHVEQWQSLYEETYGRSFADVDPTFDITGWNSSYTGEPIPAVEMAEWVDTTVAELRALRPRHALEIGCGSGLLLARLAPSCETFWGTDSAGGALAHVKRLKQVVGGLSNVTLAQRAADDFTGIPLQAFDVVLLNSVVQYFPGVDYLLRVLEGAVRAVKPGGVIYVGDVRNFTLLEAYHVSIELHGAPDALTRAELAARVEQRLLNEEELLLDAAFFHALPHHLPEIKGVQIRQKRGRHHNELTRFRYQVFLHIGESAARAGADDSEQGAPARFQDWRGEKWTVAALREWLAKVQPDWLWLKNVPNARLQNEIYTLAWLSGSHEERAVDLRRALAAAPNGVEPEALWALGDELPYTVEITLSAAGDPGAMDVSLRRRTRDDSAPSALAAVPALHPEPRRAYANNPLLGRLHRRIIPVLRDALQAKLPDHMIPASWVTLSALPLTPNGKVDRKALPAPLHGASGGKLVLPRTATEETVAQIWCEVLGISRVGIHESFFELGGHSLLATQVAARLRKAFQIELPLQILFESATIAALGARIESHAAVQAMQGAPAPGEDEDLVL